MKLSVCRGGVADAGKGGIREKERGDRKTGETKVRGVIDYLRVGGVGRGRKSGAD